MGRTRAVNICGAFYVVAGVFAFAVGYLVGPIADYIRERSKSHD
jgi:hypothetical protein